MDGRYIAVGLDPLTDEALVIVSDDRRTWIRAEGPVRLFADSRMTDGTGNGGVVIAVGKSDLWNGAIWTYIDR